MEKNSSQETAFEEIEHLLAQNKVQEAIERLRTEPEHQTKWVNFSRRWRATQEHKQMGRMTTEQVEAEVNKIVEAMMEICAAGEGQFAVRIPQSQTTSQQPSDPSVHQNGRDYFEKIGDDVYNAPVKIDPQGESSGTPQKTEQQKFLRQWLREKKMTVRVALIAVLLLGAIFLYLKFRSTSPPVEGFQPLVWEQSNWNQSPWQ